MSAVLQEMTWDPPSNAAQITPKLDEALFERMWSFVPQLRGYLRHRLSPMEAEDVIQDVFVRLFQCASCHTVTFPKSYLFETAHAVLIDRRRRAASRCASMHCELTDSHHPANELSPLRILLGHEQWMAVEAAIERLPMRTQEIIIAIRLEGASLKSLAERYQISTSAIEKHIGRALRALSAAFAEHATSAAASQTVCARTDPKPRATPALTADATRPQALPLEKF